MGSSPGGRLLPRLWPGTWKATSVARLPRSSTASTSGMTVSATPPGAAGAVGAACVLSRGSAHRALAARAAAAAAHHDDWGQRLAAGVHGAWCCVLKVIMAFVSRESVKNLRCCRPWRKGTQHSRATSGTAREFQRNYLHAIAICKRQQSQRAANGLPWSRQEEGTGTGTGHAAAWGTCPAPCGIAHDPAVPHPFRVCCRCWVRGRVRGAAKWLDFSEAGRPP